MAENALTKKLGPQPRWAWGAEAIAAILLWRFIRARRSGSGLTSVTATPLTGGNTIPLGQSSGAPTGPGGFSTISGWITAMLGVISTTPGYSNTAALNDLTSWLNGSCVSSIGFTAIGNAITSVGLPPGYSTPPTLSVCPSTNPSNNNGSNPAPSAPAPASPTPSPQPPSAPPLSNFTNQIVGNVISIFQQGTGWVYVTDQGYVYNSPGSNYYGGTDAGAVGGSIAAHIVEAFPVNSGPNAGGYTLVASNGDTYTFGPNANYSPL